MIIDRSDVEVVLTYIPLYRVFTDIDILGALPLHMDVFRIIVAGAYRYHRTECWCSATNKAAWGPDSRVQGRYNANLPSPLSRHHPPTDIVKWAWAAWARYTIHLSTSRKLHFVALFSFVIHHWDWVQCASQRRMNRNRLLLLLCTYVLFYHRILHTYIELY